MVCVSNHASGRHVHDAQLHIAPFYVRLHGHFPFIEKTTHALGAFRLHSLGLCGGVPRASTFILVRRNVRGHARTGLRLFRQCRLLAN